jgi:integrating conjugative element protein (TIGR03752 family)
LDSQRSDLRRDQERLSNDRQQTEGLLAQMQRQLESLGKGGSQTDLPVGLGLREGEGAASTGGTGGTRWVEPDDARSSDKRAGGIGSGSSGSANKSNFPTSFGPAQRTLDTSADAATDTGTGKADTASSPKSKAKPVYTVPTNSTLMGSVAMTALIGRVPVDGTVNDPYPFKVLIGEDNLTANGIEIPDVAGAVVSGTASGDWTLSCVRGQIRSVTFVFHDGTIRTIPEGGNANQQSSNNQQTNNIQNGLGWISDPYGIPCVSGERRSNAQQYLGTQGLITAAGAGAASLIKSNSGQMSYVTNQNGSIGTVGISGNEAMGRILAGGVQEMSQWVNKLYGQAFAAVYVQPGAQVAVHLEKPLAIDYEPDGRKVDHRIGEARALELE